MEHSLNASSTIQLNHRAYLVQDSEHQTQFSSSFKHTWSTMEHILYAFSTRSTATYSPADVQHRLHNEVVWWSYLVIYDYHTSRVGHNHIYIYGVNAAFLAGKSPNIRSYTVHIYGAGQPYIQHTACVGCRYGLGCTNPAHGCTTLDGLQADHFTCARWCYTRLLHSSNSHSRANSKQPRFTPKRILVCQLGACGTMQVALS